jgi:hypothetical protein
MGKVVIEFSDQEKMRGSRELDMGKSTGIMT